MSQIRIHEVAKALGISSKILMVDLAKEGHEFKTHMAVLDADLLKLIEKKHPDLNAKLEAAAKAAAEAPPKEKKPRATKAGKVITSKSGAKKASEVISEEPDPREARFVQRDEGTSGTVTLEQRVVSGGVIRRRRVDPGTVGPAPSAAPEQTQAVPTESSSAQPDFVAPMPASTPTPTPPQAPRNLSAPQPVIRRVAPAPAPERPIPQKINLPGAAPKAPAPKAAAPQGTGVAPQRSTLSPLVQPSGRNLSAPSRLKVVEQTPQAPLPQTPRQKIQLPPASPARGSAVGSPRTDRGPGFAQPEEVPTDEEAKAKATAAKKRPAARSGEEADRLTKRDLIGMMEEVEIQRPLGRRPKKAAIRTEKKQTQITTPGASKRKIRIHDEISVSDLANQMGIKGAEIVRKLISMGQMASLTAKLDHDTAVLIASDYKYEVINVAETAESVLGKDAGEEVDTGAGQTRAPIVTIMGHVDHGKTSLLDYIRKSRVVAGEAGGITQHIGAYRVRHNDKDIAFLDTPGHAAFTAMRARGASVTDICILVVAADEGVKPQTLEALAHAQAAKVPVIVAVNKIDKPEAKPENVINELSGKGLVPEDWGGDTIYVRLSAKTGEGVDKLLEMILLQAEVLDLKSNPDRPGKGIVIESRLDKGKGPVATVMVQSGTLRQGDPIVSGSTFGKVRAMFNDHGSQIKEAGPSTPVEVLGFDGVPEVGEVVSAVGEDAIARRASDLAGQAKKKAEQLKSSRMSLEDMYKKMQSGEVAELRVILKGDVQGSIEAIADSLSKIKHEKVSISVIFKAVGGITESDIDLAAASGAIIFGFNVRPTNQAKAQAARDNVQIKTYDIIYELLDEVKLAMSGLLAPLIKENVVGQAEVREVFNITKVGPIAGCMVKSGKILRSANIRVIRDSVVIYTSKIHSLKRFKDDAREVPEGMECGIRVENFTDLKPGDVLECFETVELKQGVG